MSRFTFSIMLGLLFLCPSLVFAEGEKVYTLVIKDHRFAPAELKVPAGEKIKLIVDNQDVTPEEFESHDLKREKIIQGKNKGTVLVGPLKAGTYRFFGEFNQETAQGVLIADGGSTAESSAQPDDLWQEEERKQHGHTGEHGGQFGDASDVYHYEVLLDGQRDVRVYVYDEKAMPIPNITNIKTRWTLNPDAEHPLTGPLSLSEDKKYFVLDLPPLTSSVVSVKIEAEKNEKWWPVEFLLSENEGE